MVHQYIARELLRKNRGVYFKNGKWIIHLFLLFGTAFAFSLTPGGRQEVAVKGIINTIPNLLTAGLFALFFYSYCLYLIPVCFKQGRYRRFWILLVAGLLGFALLNAGIQQVLIPHHAAFRALGRLSLLNRLQASLVTFLGYFLGFTSLLYLMELIEEIRTAREIRQHSEEQLLAERRLLRTRIDPDFVGQALDGIIALADGKDEEAPDAVIRFSDILRYRLYRSTAPVIALEDELQQLDNLIRLHNATHGAEAFCTLETEGFPGGKTLPPLALIHIAEPLLNLYQPGTGWSLLLYLLIDGAELQVAAELTTTRVQQLANASAAITRHLHTIFGTAAAFSLETAGATNSIRLCLPLQNS